MDQDVEWIFGVFEVGDCDFVGICFIDLCDEYFGRYFGVDLGDVVFVGICDAEYDVGVAGWDVVYMEFDLFVYQG